MLQGNANQHVKYSEYYVSAILRHHPRTERRHQAASTPIQLRPEPQNRLLTGKVNMNERHDQS